MTISLSLWSLRSSSLLLLWMVTTNNVTVNAQRFDCNPCIDRTTFRIKAITHGTKSSTFWQQTRAAAIQAAKDLRVELDFELYDDAIGDDDDVELIVDKMAKDIQQAGGIGGEGTRRRLSSNNTTTTMSSSSSSGYYDALLVSIPSAKIHNAIKAVVNNGKGIPIFGINSGYNVGRSLGVLGFVAMDEYLGGQQAAQRFLDEVAATDSPQQQSNNNNNNNNNKTIGISNALFIRTKGSPDKDNTAIPQRYQGFRDKLLMEQQQQQQQLHNNNSTNTNLTKNDDTIQVKEFLLDMSANDNDDNSNKELDIQLEGCPYQAILLGTDATFDIVTKALKKAGCSSAQQSGRTLLGTFDVSTPIYQAIAVGEVLFAISQQHHLQGTLGVLFATIYATMGMNLAPSSTVSAASASASSDEDKDEEDSFGAYLSGPHIVDFHNLPTDKEQVCEADAFPVCPNQMGLDGMTESQCPCSDRSNIKIGGSVLAHDGPFWERPHSMAYQAAAELGVEVDWDLWAQDGPGATALSPKVVSKTLSLCREGVKGMFVSIADDAQARAVQECQKLEIPILSINADGEKAINLGLYHHIGQVEFRAGYEAGKRMIQSGMKRGVCPNIDSPPPYILDRCLGFEAAINDSATTTTTTNNVTYLGMPTIPFDNHNLFVQNVEEWVAGNGGNEGDDDDDEWEGIGILLLSSIFLAEGLDIKQRHPASVMGMFDYHADTAAQVPSDVDILFYIDQGEFLQGYLPVWLLTIMVETNQRLINKYLETGPNLVERHPSSEELVCYEGNFEVCPPPIDIDLNQLTQVRPAGYAFAAIPIATSLFFIGWLQWHRKNPVVAKAQPTFLVLVAIGVCIMTSTIFTLGIDDSIASDEQASKACMASPWLFAVGFVFTFGALFVKLWRIDKVVQRAVKFRRQQVTVRQVMLPLVILVCLCVIFMAIWTALDPMVFVRYEVCDGSSIGVCKRGETSLSTTMFALVVCVLFVTLMLVLFQAFKMRRINAQFSESRFIFIIMIGVLQINIIGLPLMALVAENPVASYFIKVSLVFVLSMTVLLLLFLPKMVFLSRENRKKKERKVDEQSVGDDGSTGSKGERPGTFLGSLIGSLHTSQEKKRSSKVPALYSVKPKDSFFGNSDNPGPSELETAHADLVSKVLKLEDLLRLMKFADSTEVEALFDMAEIDLKELRKRTKDEKSFGTMLDRSIHSEPELKRRSVP